MTRKRIPTICEWALGFTVDEYVGAYERRRRSREGGTKQRERFRVEVSTDDESEEDTIKITYPRSGASNEKPAQGKKVRFDKEPPKSALKEPLGSEATTDTDATSETDPPTENDASETEESQEASDSSHVDSPQKGKKKKKTKTKSKAQVPDPNTSTSEGESDDEVTSPSSEKAKKSEKNKSSGDSGDNLVDGPPEDEDQKPKKKKKGDGKAKEKQEPEVVAGTSKPNRPVSEKKGKTKKRLKKSQAVDKVQPEAFLPSYTRRPNLIMPVRAEVLQVEHTIEGIEDPRPNAFHDAQHNVLRVYHGPVYGNPNGMLYPRRDPSRSALPIGTPHPLMNPYFYGFADPANSGSAPFQGQSPWSHIPYPYKFGPSMMTPPSIAQENPAQTATGPAPQPVAQPTVPPTEPTDSAGSAAAAEPHQAQDTPTGGETEKASPPQNVSSPDQSGAKGAEEMSPQRTENKDKGRDSNIAPQNAFPINVNMYSYGSRPDPWSRAGRERYAKLDQGFNSSAEGPGTKDFWDGSCRNNRGPAMYDRDAANRAAGPSKSDTVHPDLLWSPRPAQQRQSSPRNGTGDGNAGGWHNQASPEANNNWGDSNWGNNNSWQTTNLQGDTSWGASNPPENWGESAAGGNWAEPADNSGKGGRRSSASSSGSKKSTKSNPQNPVTNLGSANNKTNTDNFDASWGGTAAAPNGSPSAQKPDQSGLCNAKSSTMPGAWDSGVAAGNDTGWEQTTNAVDNGGFSWGDASAAQVPAGDGIW
ncbi:hypothetical protein ACRALDRAFT_1072618 [Sodiomyces alcalophilus JCM 7366]|uniref:uncharacterized protein n=1 Tax=Sodiomyces alcalophilus JCM 7366 TaxID=591952 RepID=UPI0039B41F04